MLKQLILAVLGAVTMMTSLPDSIPAQSGFYHTVGRNIISPDGKKTTLYGMGFGNDVWCSSLSEVGLHHNEDSFREMKDLGFNSVRFLLNYRWFEDDDKPYTYKQEGFDYIDQSIAWAKKYGIGLVLNMHYPQGGYQSQGKGTALWTDPENQKRLVSLWGEIARGRADDNRLRYRERARGPEYRDDTAVRGAVPVAGAALHRRDTPDGQQPHNLRGARVRLAGRRDRRNQLDRIRL